MITQKVFLFKHRTSFWVTVQGWLKNGSMMAQDKKGGAQGASTFYYVPTLCDTLMGCFGSLGLALKTQLGRFEHRAR